MYLASLYAFPSASLRHSCKAPGHDAGDLLITVREVSPMAQALSQVEPSTSEDRQDPPA